MGSYVKLLYPGLRIKRWVGLLGVGITLASLGVAYLLVQVYRSGEFPGLAFYLTFQFVDRGLRGILFLGIGLLLSTVSVVQLNRALLAPFRQVQDGSLPDILHRYHRRRRGPKIVAIGGGTGLSTLLRGLKNHTDHLTAIVTVADDGGSSGRLRHELGILPPGDFRQCLIALAEVEPLMTRLFQYRFDRGEALGGHSFGNLFIAAMAAITGNFERGLRESSRVLAVRGRIVPSTLDRVTLCAQFDDDDTVRGESAIPRACKRIRRVFLQPARPAAYPEAVRALLEADLIVIGPGSLYTSVLPNLLVEAIPRAIRASRAFKVYVCNTCNEPGETDGFQVADYVRAFERHVGPRLFECVLVNRPPRATLSGRGRPGLVPMLDAISEEGYRVAAADVIDALTPHRHDSHKLAASLLRLYERRGHATPALADSAEPSVEPIPVG